MNYLELFHQLESEQGTVLPQSGFLQAEGPECPFGLLFAPFRRVEVRSRAGNVVVRCLSRSEQAP